MGIGASKLRSCCSGPLAGDAASRRFDSGLPGKHEGGFVHAFSYVRPEPNIVMKPDATGSMEPEPDIKDAANTQTTTFRSISGASIGANPSTSQSTFMADSCCKTTASALECSACFASGSLRPVAPGGTEGKVTWSGLFPSGKNDQVFPMNFGKQEEARKGCSCKCRLRDCCRTTKTSQKTKSKKERSLGDIVIGAMKSLVMRRKSDSDGKEKSVAEPIHQSGYVMESDSDRNNNESATQSITSSGNSSSYATSSSADDNSGRRGTMESQNLQWAQGKAGEDRVHIVFSEENRWVFVGIYDGFNGPDAPDFLLNNLYRAVHKELKGLLWNDKFESSARSSDSDEGNSETQMIYLDCNQFCDSDKENPLDPSLGLDVDYQFPASGNVTPLVLDLKRQMKLRRNAARNFRKQKWKYEWDRERLELDRILKEQLNCQGEPEDSTSVNHNDVLRALSRALKKTEEAFFRLADKTSKENPELALMGSCVLVMLMKGEDLYVMNVGDSRAVLAKISEPNLGLEARWPDLEAIDEETKSQLEAFNAVSDDDQASGIEFDESSMTAVQLTTEHSTNMEEEVERIKKQHPDDASAIENARVKGYLKVTRAFGAGFLKQPKWNDALLEMFRINYIGSSPYLTCSPSLHHHRLGLSDRFLILSSDGLYEHFNNDEVVCEVECFIAACPEGDPAQHLIEQVLLRAANRYGMDFHELLEIPQGERRRYHDDVSVIIISLEGRIWRSSM